MNQSAKRIKEKLKMLEITENQCKKCDFWNFLEARFRRLGIYQTIDNEVICSVFSLFRIFLDAHFYRLHSLIYTMILQRFSL